MVFINGGGNLVCGIKERLVTQLHVLGQHVNGCILPSARTNNIYNRHLRFVNE